MVPPLKRKESVKRMSFMQRRKETLKIEDPEQMTIAQLKATLRAASVSEHDIALCIERSQLNTLYKERLDKEFNACVVVQRHWRLLVDSRKVRTLAVTAPVLPPVRAPLSPRPLLPRSPRAGAPRGICESSCATQPRGNNWPAPLC